MSAGFTSGPWGFHPLPDDLDFDFEVTRPNDGLPLAAIYVWHLGRSEANARLIAAAPDGYSLAVKFIREAVAEFNIPPDADEGWVVDTLGHGMGGVYLDALAFLAKVGGEQ